MGGQGLWATAATSSALQPQEGGDLILDERDERTDHQRHALVDHCG